MEALISKSEIGCFLRDQGQCCGWATHLPLIMPASLLVVGREATEEKCKGTKRAVLDFEFRRIKRGAQWLLAFFSCFIFWKLIWDMERIML